MFSSSSAVEYLPTIKQPQAVHCYFITHTAPTKTGYNLTLNRIMSLFTSTQTSNPMGVLGNQI